MASIIPVATQALALFETVNTVANVFDNSKERSQQQALQQLQQQQGLQQQQSAEDAALNRQEIQVQAERAETERRNALKRAVARQRAQFGASGVGSSGGSSEAVLLDLFEESDEERISREQLDQLRNQSIDQNLLQQNSVNTLRRTQLAERQRLLNNSSTLDDVSKLLSVF